MLTFLPPLNVTAEALALCAPYANHYHKTFEPWALSGPHNAGVRQAVLTKLTGFKVPKAKAGVNALAKALTEACRVTPEEYTCNAALYCVFYSRMDTLGLFPPARVECD